MVRWVEGRASLEGLQPIDNREAAVVADYDDQFVAGQDGAVDVGVHHQV